jgi:hypothetical protein
LIKGLSVGARVETKVSSIQIVRDLKCSPVTLPAQLELVMNGCCLCRKLVKVPWLDTVEIGSWLGHVKAMKVQNAESNM